MKKLFFILILLGGLFFFKDCFAATYEIYTLADLQAIAPYHALDNCVLMNDIDASATSGWNGGAGFLPISFEGTFDGQGHIITGLFINRPTTDYVGLFANVNLENNAEEDCWIKNVNMVNVNITGRDFVGGLVGASDYQETSNCSTSGTVSGRDWVGGVSGFVGGGGSGLNNSHSSANVTGRWRIGGLAGQNSNQMSYCYATGNVVSDAVAGGLVGAMESYYSVTNCYATGNVRGQTAVGGFAGSIGGGGAGVSNSYSTGNVTSLSGEQEATQIGGFAGATFAPITNCYATGNVDLSLGDVYAGGGFIGETGGIGVTISNCYATGNVIGGSADYVGGFAGVFLNATLKNSFAVGVITGSGSYYLGGLIGDNQGTVTNCGWWTGQCAIPIGSGGSVTYNETLKSAFYDKTHNLYDTVAPLWDFTTPIWYQWTNNFPIFRKYMGGVMVID